MDINSNYCNNNHYYNNDNDKLEIELLDLRMYIHNFVFSNWNYINFKTKTEEIVIDLDLEDDEYINDDEIFYKGILYT